MIAYRTVLRSTLDWVVGHAEQFGNRTPETPTAASLTLYKPLCELVLAADVLATYGDPEIARLGRTYLEDAWHRLHDGDVIAKLLVERADLPVFIMTYPSFRRFGMTSTRLEQSIREHFAVRGYAYQELPGWFRHGVERLLAMLGAPSPWSARQTLADSWLGARSEPWTLTIGSAYGVTHAVFYATDIGVEPDALPPELREYLEAWLPVWIRRYQRVHNADLLAELVMTARCIRAPDVDDYGTMLAELVGTDGALVSSDEARANDDDRDRDFLARYHTTLVALSAAVMSVRLLGR
jgi:hypothetical protein